MTQTLRRELKQKISKAVDSYLNSANGIVDWDEIYNVATNAALEVRGISKLELPPKSGMDWMIAANLPAEEIERLSQIETNEKEKTDEYERAMGYNPLSWGSNDLEPLAKFLAKQSLEDIRRFADWCKKDFSPLSPAKARQHPHLVKDLWPQACPPIEERKIEPPKEPEVYADLTKLKIFRDLEEERDE